MRERQDKLHFSDLAQGVKLFLKFNRYILRYWKLLLLILILGNISTALSLVNPYIGKLILDKGILAKNISALIIYSILIGVVFIFSSIFSSIYDYLKNYAQVKVEVNLNREVFKRLKNYSLSQLQLRPSAVNLFRMTFDVSSASTIINVTLIHLINAFFKIIFVTCIIAYINPAFLLIIVVYQLFIIAKMKFLLKFLEENIREGLEKGENIYRLLNNFFSHIYLIKAFASMNWEIMKYMHGLFERMRLNLKGARLRAIDGFSIIVSDKLFFGILAFYGSFLVIGGKISLGTMAAALLYISQGASAYSSLTSMIEQFVLNKVSLERLAGLLEEPASIQRETAIQIRPQDIREIEFRNVTFGYSDENNVLQDLSITIKAASHIGLVGRSGCGKTTLISLILGLYSPKNGKILIGNNELLHIDSTYLLNNIGIALQEPFLFDDTIGNNISYAVRNASRQNVIEAASLVGLSNFIESLPEGYDTIVGENAYKLSQGQKQRIAIARALIKKPQVLILDEAMSSLDSETETKIIANIKSRFIDSTVIIVSHRLSSVKQMDLVYFLSSPKIMQIGGHETLVRQAADYKELFRAQIYENDFK